MAHGTDNRWHKRMVSAFPANDFGQILRSWRTARGLSQADLAHAVETPSRHVSFLETGRSSPSREMVSRLATAMNIPLSDRNLMLRAAGFADIYPPTELSGSAMDILRRTVQRMMTAHEPCPSFVIDRGWFVRDANRSARRMMSMISEAFPLARVEKAPNILDMAFSPEGFRPYITNWPEYACQLIQRIHREALSPSDLRAAMDRIGRFPDLPSRWWRLDAQYMPNPVFPIRMVSGGQEMHYFSVIAAIASPTGILAQELRGETLFPADSRTEAALSASFGQG